MLKVLDIFDKWLASSLVIGFVMAVGGFTGYASYQCIPCAFICIIGFAITLVAARTLGERIEKATHQKKEQNHKRQ